MPALPRSIAAIRKTFKGAEELEKADLPIFIAFWFAVGAGLRKEEIFRMRWEFLVEVNGRPWIVGPIGKNGKVISVPVQAKAMRKLEPHRKERGPVLGEKESMEYSRRLNTFMRLKGWETEKKMHELRAYIGSLIYRKDPKGAKEFMRHDSIKTTEKKYLRYGKVADVPEVL